MSATTLVAKAGRPAGKLPAYLDWAQMGSGLALALFIAIHLLSVSTVIFGGSVMTGLDTFYERIGLTQIGLPAVGLLIVLHFILAARKIPVRTAQQTTMLAHAKRMRHADTWLWVTQAVTGMVVLVLGLTHLWTILTDLPADAVKSAARVQGGWWYAFYLVLLPAVVAHAAIGCYRIGVKWGLLDRAGRLRATKAQWAAIAVLLVLGLCALLRFYFLPLK